MTADITRHAGQSGTRLRLRPGTVPGKTGRCSWNETTISLLPLAAGQSIGGDGKTLHLHATDADSEWVITLHPERADAARGHAKADAALRGRACDLLLMVWGRDPLGAVEHLGDESVIAAFWAAART